LNLLNITKINNWANIQAKDSKLKLKAVNLNQTHCTNLLIKKNN